MLRLHKDLNDIFHDNILNTTYILNMTRSKYPRFTQDSE